ncbi:hypothetical protein PD280_04830 [Virgibacillus salarius]|uniref:hypothetical protein n=1 Tax=Virgibacillus salarius TaxID=447199 RepID=UPI002490E4B9|nr:hypothetical protein [Virgibacillus salarius]WBX81100.1 hypothetical protein PD280_04830 [Virgibacillus salarius]
MTESYEINAFLDANTSGFEQSMQNASGAMNNFMNSMNDIQDVGGSFTELQESFDPVVNKLSEMEESLGFILRYVRGDSTGSICS